MKSHAFSNTLIYVGVVVLLSACGSGDADNASDPNAPITRAPDINPPTVFEGQLSKLGGSSVERFLKNGIYSNSLASSELNLPVLPAAINDNSGSSGNFSETNTIESGVDEADRIKYDGEYMYVAEIGDYFLPEPSTPAIRVLKRKDDYSLTGLPNLISSHDFMRVDGMYLHENKLAVIGVEENNYVFDANTTSFLGVTSGRISVSIFNVEDPAQASESSAFQIEGDILGTRRINKNIYIVSRFVPKVDSLISNASSDNEKLSNYNKVASAAVSELMPKYYRDQQGINLNSPEDCYLPELASSIDGYAELVTVTKIDVTAPENMQSLCMSINPSMMYMSVNNLYFAGNIWDEAEQSGKTQLHKFDLENFEYAASGTANGELGWRANSLFRISESDEKLRVLTTQYPLGLPEHSLHVLEQQGEDLQLIASLPNTNRPEPIGKPNEEVFAVRFVGDKAYVVTFERLDPLYVINLSNQADPFIEGSLEIPGFSSYIQVLDNDYLLGIGQEVRTNDLPDVGSEPDLITIPMQSLGVKISLFDVGDPSDPIELSSLVFDNGFTPAENDYKALSVLNTQGKYQFALPLEEWGNNVSNASVFGNSLLLLETDTSVSVPRLTRVHQVMAESDQSFYYGGYLDRSIIQDDKVYYLHGNQVWLSNWAGDGELLGPY